MRHKHRKVLGHSASVRLRATRDEGERICGHAFFVLVIHTRHHHPVLRRKNAKQDLNVQRHSGVPYDDCGLRENLPDRKTETANGAETFDAERGTLPAREVCRQPRLWSDHCRGQERKTQGIHKGYKTSQYVYPHRRLRSSVLLSMRRLQLVCVFEQKPRPHGPTDDDRHVGIDLQHHYLES